MAPVPLERDPWEPYKVQAARVPSAPERVLELGRFDFGPTGDAQAITGSNPVRDEMVRFAENRPIPNGEAFDNPLRVLSEGLNFYL